MKQITLNRLQKGTFHINYDELVDIVRDVQKQLRSNSISQLDSQLIGILISRMACGELVLEEIGYANQKLQQLGYEVIIQ